MIPPMPRAEKPKARRPVAATNPNTSTIYARAPASVSDDLDAWVRELNAAADASGDPRRWTKNDVVVAVLARRLREKKQRGGDEVELP
jgi:hypothetical protein